MINFEPKDTTSAQKKAYIILKDIDKLIVDLHSLEEIHDKNHESTIIDEEVDEIRNIRSNLKATIANAVEYCITDDMEVYMPLVKYLEVK